MVNHLKGLERFDLPTGARYLKLHHYADPSKDENWLESIRLKMADTPDDFRREILMDETVYGGQPVYSTYDDQKHVFRRNGREAVIPVLPGSLYFGGWDAGQALTPAFVLKQVAPINGSVYQVHTLLEVTSNGGETMEEFAPRVMQAIMFVLPGNWDDVRHVGDQTIVTRNGTNGKSAKEEAKRHGFNITPVSNIWPPRIAAVSWMLTREIDDQTPGSLIDGTRCPMLRQGFQGAYKYKMSASGDQAGPGAIVLMPEKNMYSHVHDANQYVDLTIRKMIEGGGTTLRR